MSVDVHELLADVAPDVAAAAEGVSDDQIRAVENALGITFPQAYRSFLQVMGESAAGFEFGRKSQTTRFADLVAELEPPEERLLRYWRMTVERDLYNPVAADFYLDLPTSDGEDAELLELCYPPDGDERPGVVRNTFFDFLRVRIFHSYVCPQLGENLTAIHVDQDASTGQVDAGLRGVFLREGISEFTPYRDKLALFFRSDISVVVDYPWESGRSGVSIYIRAAKRAGALLLVEKLRDHIPASVHVSPPRQ